ncbi:hypothetical protein NGTWS1803_02720 [Mycolicibacterium cyprinidarum]|uniref:Uncharacterized protein n=1 Tax=Mycolicibacterium cyprinidarum TaxID=2860311 RepID=A0ABQ4V530_9MYCO|nr:hypothetical protein NGTWS1702_33870 [Mycolicibacterium sp. NGTWSNA01]GJF16458.1 hypothetical protein NGTWS1803_02720 [Mycolicibacterium sp. NGTWS1803]
MLHNPAPTAITLMLIRSKIAITPQLLHSRSGLRLYLVQQNLLLSKPDPSSMDIVNLAAQTTMKEYS